MKTVTRTKAKQPKVAVRAVCKDCGKKMYSLTTNKDGLIVCPKCDKDLNQKY